MKKLGMGLLALAVASTTTLAAGPREVTLDFSSAVPAKTVWAARLSNEAIPTPGYADGKIFSGGGMQSRDFSAYNADTGTVAWHINTIDSGPTSPAIDRNRIAINTESCHAQIVDASDGHAIWSELIGSSLYNMPAIAGGLAFFSHPAQGAFNQPRYKLLCVDLQTGQHHWDVDIPGDALSAPVVSGDQIFLSCGDGSTYDLGVRNGDMRWGKRNFTTSAPVVAGNTVLVTAKDRHDHEGVKRVNASTGHPVDDVLLAPAQAESPLDIHGGAREGAQFGAAPWDYQGPKISYFNGKIFHAMGHTVTCTDGSTGQCLWTASAGSGAQAYFTPAAMGHENLYLGTHDGHLLVLRQSDGTALATYNVGAPLIAQPILARGNIYLATGEGHLLCVKATPDADAWYQWGGNAQHNKTE